MRIFLRSLLLFILITSYIYAQKNSERKYNPFSGTLVLSVEAGPTLGQTDYSKPKVDYLGRASLEYFLPAYSASSFGIKVFGGGGYIGGSDNSLTPDVFRTKLSFIGGGIVYLLSLGDYVYPYLFAGATYLRFDPMGNNGIEMPNNLKGIYLKHEVNYNGEIGFRFPITDNLSFNLTGGIQLSPNDNLDDIALGTNNDFFYYSTAGFSFSFLGDHDSDGDGVPDSKDMCPNTPIGIKVDEYGCPLDSDHDGVPDYKDKCPNTPKGVQVDKDGCPLDSDGDGIPDYRDICPNTPPGVKVDALGCPLDSDGDGVPDYLDKCPNTPANISVDSKGCPLDSDHDGVPDYKDKCPGTPPGVEVDAEGCPVKEKIKEKPKEKVPKESSKVTLSAATMFAFGKSELLPSAHKGLNLLIRVMKKNPDTRWQIAGYTDNIGSNKVNKKVSLERANAVLNYLISQGLNKSRFKVIGYGKAHPVASNTTEEGRARNRRVEIVRIK